LSRSTALKDAAGFSLIEALVALAIVAIAMASIGSLIASTARGVRSVETHLTRLETARAVMAALPGRDHLAVGVISGMIAGHAWRVTVSPFVTEDVGRKPPPQWVPQTVVVTVESPRGAAMRISTIRLKRTAAQ
jgi:general secretion pathway protein I